MWRNSVATDSAAINDAGTIVRPLVMWCYQQRGARDEQEPVPLCKPLVQARRTFFSKKKQVSGGPNSGRMAWPERSVRRLG